MRWALEGCRGWPSSLPDGRDPTLAAVPTPRNVSRNRREDTPYRPVPNPGVRPPAAPHHAPDALDAPDDGTHRTENSAPRPRTASPSAAYAPDGYRTALDLPSVPCAACGGVAPARVGSAARHDGSGCHGPLHSVRTGGSPSVATAPGSRAGRHGTLAIVSDICRVIRFGRLRRVPAPHLLARPCRPRQEPSARALLRPGRGRPRPPDGPPDAVAAA